MGKPSTRADSSANSDRKFEKKVQFYAKVRQAVSSLNAQKTISKNNKSRRRQKKLKAYDLCTLSEALPEVKIRQQRTPAPELKVNCKSRGKLIWREGKQFGTVLNHPAFNSNPLAAIHQHLESTQPVQDEKLKKKMNKNGSKKKKENKVKALEGGGAARSMEM